MARGHIIFLTLLGAGKKEFIYMPNLKFAYIYINEYIRDGYTNE